MTSKRLVMSRDKSLMKMLSKYEREKESLGQASLPKRKFRFYTSYNFVASPVCVIAL